MRRALPLIAVLLLVGALILPSCAGPAVRKQSAHVEHLEGQLIASYGELAEVEAQLDALEALPPGAADPEVVAALAQNQAQLAEAIATLKDSLKATAEGLPDAWRADWENWKGDLEENGDQLIGGVLSQGGAQGGLIGVASTILLSLWRDRRKRKGGDPLQLAGVATPPTQEGGDA